MSALSWIRLVGEAVSAGWEVLRLGKAVADAFDGEEEEADPWAQARGEAAGRAAKASSEAASLSKDRHP